MTTHPDDDPWFTTVEVVQDAVLCFLDAAAVADLRAENPDFDRQMYGYASRDVAAAHAQLVTIGRKLPAERLATFLLELEQRQVVDGQPPREVHIPISRDDIGDYLGLESATISRQFTRLRSVGAIEMLSPSRVVVLDRDALRQLSEGAEAPLANQG